MDNAYLDPLQIQLIEFVSTYRGRILARMENKMSSGSPTDPYFTHAFNPFDFSFHLTNDILERQRGN